MFFAFSPFLGIIIPGPWSKESAFLLLIAGSLIARSISDVWLIQTVTMVESSIIAMDRPKFYKSVGKYVTLLPLVI